jgi:hypothetical protein
MSGDRHYFCVHKIVEAKTMAAIREITFLAVAWTSLLFFSRINEKKNVVTSIAGRLLLFTCWLALGLGVGHLIGTFLHWEDISVPALIGGGLIGCLRGLIAADVIRRVWPEGHP